MPFEYGTKEWLESKFQLVDDDPWGHEWRSAECCRYDAVIDQLKAEGAGHRLGNQQKRILDVGCATGFFTSLLVELGADVTGLDLSETAVRRAGFRFAGAVFKAGTVFDAGFDPESFHSVTCLEMIYYLEAGERRRFVARVQELLADRGILVISSNRGRGPFLSESDLLTLLEHDFSVVRVCRYGWTIWARVEAQVFGLWQRAQKVKKLLEADGHNGEDATRLHEVVSTPGRRETVRKLTRVLDRVPGLKSLLRLLTRGAVRVIEVALSWKLPSIAADRIAGWLGLQRTHTIVVARKRAPASR